MGLELGNRYLTSGRDEAEVVSDGRVVDEGVRNHCGYVKDFPCATRQRQNEVGGAAKVMQWEIE